MNSLIIGLFVITVGFTTSGIIANLYRLSGLRPASSSGQIFRLAVLSVAGPSVIFELAVRRFLAKEWSPTMFWLTVSGMVYWSLALGTFVLDVATKL